MNYALIKNGVVVNCIVADSAFIATISSQYDVCVPYTTGTYVGPGFTYDGTNFIPPVSSSN